MWPVSDCHVRLPAWRVLVQIRFSLRHFLRPVIQERPGLPLQRLDGRKPGLDLVLVEDRFQRVAAVPLGRYVPVQFGEGLRVAVGQDDGGGTAGAGLAQAQQQGGLGSSGRSERHGV